ncbi:MAG: HlyD family type I secretion periplasmic adaptor subunit [Betaproteobacteria bacterium]|nr:HlyD family type I secretion periplasmic adaptor subunit [Betaproteobacteria bacterium]
MHRNRHCVRVPLMAKHDRAVTIEASAKEVPTKPLLIGGDGSKVKPSGEAEAAVIILGVGGFLAWAALAPLDEGIHASGTLIVDSKRKTVQNSSPGVVREIHIKEGEVVKADQLLITMDPTQARAQREIADSLYLSARASESRLLAEQQFKAQITFPSDLIQRENQAAVSLILNSQRQLFDARRNALASELGAYRESIAGLQSQLKGLEEVQVQRGLQVQTLQREVESLTPLVQDGLYARNRLQELERQLANARASLADGLSTMARIGNQMAEIKLRITQREQEFRKDLETQLSEASKEARAQAERLIALDDELRRTEVRSPVNGAIVGLSVTTRGAVLPAASRILDVIGSAAPDRTYQIRRTREIDVYRIESSHNTSGGR